MKIELGFGTDVQTVDIPRKNILQILEPNDVAVERRGLDAVSFALENPIGAPRLCDAVKESILQGKRKIVIVTSDITRPMPTAEVLPLVLDEICKGGAKLCDVTLVFALGSHRAHTEEEKRKLAGERAYGKIKIEDSNPRDCVHLGVTRHGTPVDITRTVAEADFVICLGNIEFHYFAGYSGGAKAIMPGVSTNNAIQSNHRMMIQKEACAGNILTNPIRDDIEEAGAILGIDYIVNAVLDEHKKIIYAVAGDSIKAHREGVRFLDSLFLKPIEKQADIVIVSQGGHPKDINLYQTQKALDNAKHAVRDGGTIILVGSCREGMGNSVFESWMRDAQKPQDLIDRINRDFRLGGHKAAAIALVLQKADVVLVSEMPDETVTDIFLRPAKSADAALKCAMEKYGDNASVIVMPYGGATLPKFIG